MSDTTLLSSFVASLNASVFLREFSFSRTQFKPVDGTEVELADHVVRIGDLLFLYQLKERGVSAAAPTEEWLKKKVVKKATGQIRATMRLLNSGDPVLITNERGHVFNLATRPADILLRVVLFKSSDQRTPLPYPRFHRSRSAGFVHIFDALDYFGMCQYLATPIEVADYLNWRERAVQSTADAQFVSEEALVGQYMVEDLESAPAERYAGALLALRGEVSTFDLSYLFNGLGDRIEYASGENCETSYYPMLQLLARLARSELRLLKERLLFVLKAVDEDRFELPVRFVSSTLDSGFLLIPIVSADFDSRLVVLRNLSLAAKYDKRTAHQVGISVARRGSDCMIDWFYTSSPWSHDPALEAGLQDNYPFRQTRESKIPRYQFSTDGLRRLGLLADGQHSS